MKSNARGINLKLLILLTKICLYQNTPTLENIVVEVPVIIAISSMFKVKFALQRPVIYNYAYVFVLVFTIA